MEERTMKLINIEGSVLGKTNALGCSMPRISQKLTTILPNDSVLAACHLILLLFPPKQQLFGQKSRKPKPVQIQDEPMSHATQIHYVSEELKKQKTKN